MKITEKDLVSRLIAQNQELAAEVKRLRALVGQLQAAHRSQVLADLSGPDVCAGCLYLPEACLCGAISITEAPANAIDQARIFPLEVAPVLGWAFQKVTSRREP